MKRLVVIVATLLLATLSLSAQRIEVGVRAPHLGRVEWITDQPTLGERFLMVEFFHSAAPECRARIESCNAIAHDFGPQLDVVMLTREPTEQVVSLLLHEYQYFYAASDESGGTYRAFEVSHVPYALIINPEGTIVWAGNPLKLTTSTIEKIVAQ